MLLSYGSDPNQRVQDESTNAVLRPPLAELLASNENTTFEELRILLRYGARVVMKTQFRDADGLLNYLGNVPEGVFRVLIDTAEEFDPCMIRRNVHLTDEQKRLLLERSSTPITLKAQCRTVFRKMLGRTLPENVPDFFIPQMLRRYLLYEHS